MCLPLKPYKVEREWKHARLSCAVVQGREAGNRCGYVRVPPGHPAHGKDYDHVDVSVHGGLTFADIEPCTEHEDGQGWWLGFDAAHAYDAYYDPNVDLDKVSAETRKMLLIHQEITNRSAFRSNRDHFWTEEEMVAETQKLAEQLAAWAR